MACVHNSINNIACKRARISIHINQPLRNALVTPTTGDPPAPGGYGAATSRQSEDAARTS